MGARGPQPAPPAIQALRKTRPCRKRKHPAVANPAGAGISLAANARPRPLLPLEPPDHLRDEAAACWRELAQQQENLNAGGFPPFITATDGLLVEVACESYRVWRLAKAELDAYQEQIVAAGGRPSLALISSSDGKEEPSIQKELLDKAAKEVRASFRALGLPKQMPTLIAQVTQRSASGDEQTLGLLA